MQLLLWQGHCGRHVYDAPAIEHGVTQQGHPAPLHVHWFDKGLWLGKPASTMAYFTCIWGAIKNHWTFGRFAHKNACNSQARGQPWPGVLVNSGVRHGCIAAPLLFNVFLHFMVRHALNNMRPDFGVSMQFRADGNLLYSTSPGEGFSLHQIALLFYVDDMVLFSTNLEN